MHDSAYALVGLGLAAWVGFGMWVGRMPGRKRRQRPTWQARAGKAGESRTTRILQKYGLAVWSDVRVAGKGRTSQCDQIVAGPFGLVIIETKNWAGTLSRYRGDQWSQRKRDGSVHFYDSPEGQNDYHCQVVLSVLKAHGLKQVPVVGAVVLSNPRAVFIDGPGSQPIGSPEQIAAWIRGLPAGRSFDADRVERVLRQSGAGVKRAVPWG